jgi:hypothetical protein
MEPLEQRGSLQDLSSRTSGRDRHYIVHFILQEFNQVTRELWADLKATRWKVLALWVILPTWFGSLVFALVWMPLLAIFGGYSDSACRPDGSFSLFRKDYSFWWPSGFFQVTLPVGSYTFAQAKLIDVTWDLVSYSEVPLASHTLYFRTLLFSFGSKLG